MSGVLPEAMGFNNSIMHDFNMNYYSPKTRTPHSPAAYIKEENEFYHPWSIKSSCKMYGYYKLHEILPLRDFMEMPMGVVDEMIDAVTEGRAERDKFDNPPQTQSKDDSGNDNMKAIMKQLGIDKKTFI